MLVIFSVLDISDFSVLSCKSKTRIAPRRLKDLDEAAKSMFPLSDISMLSNIPSDLPGNGTIMSPR